MLNTAIFSLVHAVMFQSFAVAGSAGSGRFRSYGEPDLSLVP